jgi:hypothetical protein
MKKYFVIKYKPYNFKDVFDAEFVVPFILIQVGLIVFTLVKNMFIEDLIGALALVLFPIIIAFPILIIMFFFSRFILIFDYKETKFIKKTMFYKKVYDLNKIEIEKQYIKCMGNNKDIIKVLIKFNGKILAKINAISFENITGFDINSILE